MSHSLSIFKVVGARLFSPDELPFSRGHGNGCASKGQQGNDGGKLASHGVEVGLDNNQKVVVKGV